MDHYEIALGTSAGAADVLDWTNVGAGTSYQLSSLSLSNDTQYYASIRAVGSSGDASSATLGDGFTVVSDSKALDFDFTTGSLDPWIQFSRASTGSAAPGTYYDFQGLVATAPTNLALYSQDMDQASWTPTNATVSANDAGVVTPDGLNTAEKIEEDATTNQHYLSQSVTLSTTGTYCFSVYLHSAERTAAEILLRSNGVFSGDTVEIDLTTGATSGAGSELDGAGAESIGNNWYRAYLCAHPQTTGSAELDIMPYNSADSYLGTTGDGIYAWGAQVEAGSSPTSYIYTTSAPAYGPRFDHDPSKCSGGVCPSNGLLMEDFSTNQLTYSEQLDNVAWTPTGASVSADVAVSPDGNSTADSLDEDGTTGTHGISQSISSSNNFYAYTVYAKPNGRSQIQLSITKQGSGNVVSSLFTLSGSGTAGAVTVTGTATAGTAFIEALPNGWYRCGVSGMPDSSGAATWVAETDLANGGSTSYTGSGGVGVYLWGAQLEVGWIATSYIPTTSAAVLRNADSAVMNDLSWFTGAAGTVMTKFDVPYFGSWTWPWLFSLQSGGTVEYGAYFNDGDGVSSLQQCAQVEVSGNPTACSGPAMVRGVPETFAVRFEDNNVGISAAGDTVGSISSVTLPTGLDQFVIGGGQYTLNGHLWSLRYYPNNLTDQQIQALSAP